MRRIASGSDDVELATAVSSVHDTLSPCFDDGHTRSQVPAIQCPYIDTAQPQVSTQHLAWPAGATGLGLEMQVERAVTVRSGILGDALGSRGDSAGRSWNPGFERVRFLGWPFQ